jgi:hypothetical protein
LSTNKGVFLDFTQEIRRLWKKCETFHTQNVKRFTFSITKKFFPQKRVGFYFAGWSDTVKKSPRPLSVRSIRMTSSKVNGLAPRRPNTAI